MASGILHVDEDADRAWAEAAPGIAYLEGELARDRGPGLPHARALEALRLVAERVIPAFG